MMTCCCLVCTLILWPRSFGPHCSPWWIADEMKCCSRLRVALRMNCETPLTESWGRWLTITCSTDVFATFGQQEQFVMHNTNICHHLLRWHAVSAQLLILTPSIWSRVCGRLLSFSPVFSLFRLRFWSSALWLLLFRVFKPLLLLLEFRLPMLLLYLDDCTSVSFQGNTEVN